MFCLCAVDFNVRKKSTGERGMGCEKRERERERRTSRRRGLTMEVFVFCFLIKTS
jgi:hypothetical protein